MKTVKMANVMLAVCLVAAAGASSQDWTPPGKGGIKGIAVPAVGGTKAYDERGAVIPVAMPRADQEAPDFTLEDLEGREVSLKDFRGKVVLLDFWTTWCPACRSDTPKLITLHSKYFDKGLVVVGIDVQESKSTVSNYVQRSGVNYTMLLDGRGEAFRSYGGRGYPTYVLIDRDGKIIAQDVWPAENLEPLIEKALGLTKT